MLHSNRDTSIVRWVIHLLSCLIHYRITWLLAGDGRAWKVDGRVQSLVGRGLATPLSYKTLASVGLAQAHPNNVLIVTSWWCHDESFAFSLWVIIIDSSESILGSGFISKIYPRWPSQVQQFIEMWKCQWTIKRRGFLFHLSCDMHFWAVLHPCHLTYSLIHDTSYHSLIYIVSLTIAWYTLYLLP